MNKLKYLALAIIVGVGLITAAPKAEAQIAVQIGPAPMCPYGYYDFAPYNCAPYGYYGPQWFNSGIFIGAGPWFHGPRGFRGRVDYRFHPRYGYRGGFPGRGEAPRPGWRGAPDRFRGNGYRDGRGHGGRR
ncbi:MAG TPA: hypothetical protein VGC07_03185 [Granulicella sp.]